MVVDGDRGIAGWDGDLEEDFILAQKNGPGRKSDFELLTLVNGVGDLLNLSSERAEVERCFLLRGKTQSPVKVIFRRSCFVLDSHLVALIGEGRRAGFVERIPFELIPAISGIEWVGIDGVLFGRGWSEWPFFLVVGELHEANILGELDRTFGGIKITRALGSPIGGHELSFPDGRKCAVLRVEGVVHSAGESHSDPAVSSHAASSAIGAGFVGDG